MRDRAQFQYLSSIKNIFVSFTLRMSLCARSTWSSAYHTKRSTYQNKNWPPPNRRCKLLLYVPKVFKDETKNKLMRSQGNRITVFGVGGLNWIPFLAALKLLHALWVGLRPSMRKVLLFVRLLDCEKNRKLKSSIRWIPSDLNFGSINRPEHFSTNL